MKLSKKVRCGIQAMMDLVAQSTDQPVPLRVLAKKQDIPLKYLEQIAGFLRTGGLIVSVRGTEGGYRLAKPPTQITAWDIYSALGSSLVPSKCDPESSCPQPTSAIQELWGKLSETTADILKSQNLEQLIKRQTELNDETNAHHEETGSVS